MTGYVQPLATTSRRALRRLPILATNSAEHELMPPSGPGAARFVPVGFIRKLDPVEHLPTGSRPRPRAHAPFVSTTDVSIVATCSDA